MSINNKKVTQISPDLFPLSLKSSVNAPQRLFVLGTLPESHFTGVAFVGTRRPSSGAEIRCENLIQALKGTNAVVVSGLAQGIDSFCHAAALSHGIPTLAVLAQGLEAPLHGTQKQLARRILDAGGALISEYPGTTPSYKSSFPARNRIIAGLSTSTVLVESKKKGGAMITAAFCLKENRELLALPGNSLQTVCEGPHMLLRSGKAKPIWFFEDLPFLCGVQKKLDVSYQSLKQAGICLQEKTEKLWKENAGYLRSIQELQSSSLHNIPSLLAILTELEMTGLVHTQDGYLFHFISETAETYAQKHFEKNDLF